MCTCQFHCALTRAPAVAVPHTYAILWSFTLDSRVCRLAVHEEFVGEVGLTVLNRMQFCVIINPMNSKTGGLAFGSKKLMRVGVDSPDPDADGTNSPLPVQGECSFFLHPGERLESGIQVQIP